MSAEDEQQILLKSLSKALDEAWEKANKALQDIGQDAEGYEKKVWAAAESAEYASLLFSLTYDLEDVDPPPPMKKIPETRDLVRGSVEALRHVRKPRGKQKTEDYKNLRTAVHYLRTAHLDLARKPGKTRHSLTRS